MSRQRDYEPSITRKAAQIETMARSLAKAQERERMLQLTVRRLTSELRAAAVKLCETVSEEGGRKLRAERDAAWREAEELRAVTRSLGAQLKVMAQQRDEARAELTERTTWWNRVFGSRA